MAQGRATDQAASTLHPFAPIFTGRPTSELPLDKLKVPAGFKVEVYAEGIPEARSLALGDKGTVFVSNRNLKDVYAIGSDQGGKRTVTKVLKGLNSPNGIAFHNGTLYVAERHCITAYEGIEDRLATPPEGRVVIDNLDRRGRQATSGGSWRWGPTASCISTSAHPATSSCRAMRRRRSTASIRRGRDGGLREGRAQLGRLRLGPAHEGALFHQPRARLGQRGHFSTSM